MEKFKEDWNMGFKIDNLIYPNKNVYAISWTIVIVACIVGIIGALIKGGGGVSLIVLGSILFLSIVIDDYYSRRYIRKQIIEKKVS